MQFGYFIMMLVLSLAVAVLIRSMGPKRVSPAKEGAAHDHKHKHKLGHDHNSGVFSIDYYAYISAIRDWNPMFKVFFSLVVLILVIAIDSLYVSLFVLITMGFLTVVRGRIPLHQYISTHDVDFAYRWTNRAIVFCGGKIIADDTPQNVFRNEDILNRASLKRPTMLDVYDILRDKGLAPDLDVYPKTPAQLNAILG